MTKLQGKMVVAGIASIMLVAIWQILSFEAAVLVGLSIIISDDL